MQIESKSHLLELHSDVRGYLFGFLNSRTIGKLIRTCKAFKTQLDTENKWRELFIKESSGHIPECSNWKEAYSRQALVKRNLEYNNIKYPSTEGHKIYFLKDFWVECGYIEIIIHDNLATQRKIPVDIVNRGVALRCEVLHDNVFITHETHVQEPFHQTTLWQPNDFFTIWDGPVPVRKVYGSGIFKFIGDFIIKTDLSLETKVHHRITSLKNGTYLFEIKKSNLLDFLICGDFFIGFINNEDPKSICGFNLKTKSLAYQCSFNFKYPLHTFHNEQFVVLLDDSGKTCFFKPHDAHQLENISETMTPSQLNGNFLYANDNVKPHVLYRIDLQTKQILTTYQRDPFERLHSLLIDGNRLLAIGPASSTLFDTDTGRQITCIFHDSLNRPEFAVYPPFLYEKNELGCFLYNIGSGICVFNPANPTLRFGNAVITLGNCRYFDKQQGLVIDLLQPLPPQKALWKQVASWFYILS